jgi:hypothetical protein
MEIQSTVHYLPCDFGYDGPAEVLSFFKISKDESESGLFNAQLRGHELFGEDLNISTAKVAVKGLIVVAKTGNSGSPDEDEENENLKLKESKTKLRVMGEFNKMTIWQHDTKPETSKVQDYIDWFEISDAVHS